jgi:hypothetical protein
LVLQYEDCDYVLQAVWGSNDTIVSPSQPQRPFLHQFFNTNVQRLRFNSESLAATSSSGSNLEA